MYRKKEREENTMKALVYTTPAVVENGKALKPGACELMDIPEPQLQPEDGMKIKIEYCAMCATDVHIVTLGLYGMKTPWVMGHELCGTIVEINQSAIDAGFQLGDKVVVNLSAPCGCCDECKRGHDIFCKHPIRGSFSGGFTEYCTAKPQQCFKIPENSGVDPKYYCLAEPMASAMDGMDLSQIKIGDNVLLQGCGAIGSIILNMLLLKGGANVTVSDPIPEKRELALKLGAQYVIDPTKEDLQQRAMEITGGRGYDVIFDAAGVPKAAPLLPKLLANKGTLVYFAVFPMDYELPLNLYELYMKEGRVQTVYTTIYNYPRVIDLIPRMQLDTIVTREMKLSEGVDIFNAFLESKNNKIIVKCDE